jgi:hypothetical protein
MVFHDIGHRLPARETGPSPIFSQVLILISLKSLVFACADFTILSGTNLQVLIVQYLDERPH